MADPDAADILIFEDDPEMGALAEAVVSSLGYSCKRYLDGRRVLELAKGAPPQAIITDIMMPGMDGLRLCKALKSDPATAGIKVIVISAKEGEFERPRAERAGATAYLQKPYSPDALGELVREVAGAPRAALAAAMVRVSFWGLRGPAANPVPQSRYGKNSSCVLVECGSGQTIILDAGTGLGPCAQYLARRGGPKAATLLLTHYHADHVKGLPQLELANDPEAALFVLGPDDVQVGLNPLLKQALPQMKASLKLAVLREESYILGPRARLQALYAHHGTTTLAFALEVDGQKIVYCPDSELDDGAEVQFSNYRDKLTRFAASADLLIHDAHFLPEHYASARGAGHSAWPAALRLAAAASAKRLAFFHLADSYPDAVLDIVQKQADAMRASLSPKLQCFVPREAQVVEIASKGTAGTGGTCQLI